MFLQQVINSLMIGSLYALTAMGATLIYGILGILDIANAGAYLLLGRGWWGVDIGYGKAAGNWNSDEKISCFSFYR